MKLLVCSNVRGHVRWDLRARESQISKKCADFCSVYFQAAHTSRAGLRTSSLEPLRESCDCEVQWSSGNEQINTCSQKPSASVFPVSSSYLSVISISLSFLHSLCMTQEFFCYMKVNVLLKSIGAVPWQSSIRYTMGIYFITSCLWLMSLQNTHSIAPNIYVLLCIIFYYCASLMSVSQNKNKYSHI